MGKFFCEQKSFHTHDNGCQPFNVIIHDLNIEVYKQGGWMCDCPVDECECEPEEPVYNEKICEYNCLEILIGKSPLCKMTEYSGGHGPSYDGNSILALITRSDDGEKKYTYLFIGSVIITFELDCKIALFLSHVGNNDVPYPYAITENGDYILLLDYKIMKFEPYIYYYEMYGEGNDEHEDLTLFNVNVVHERNCY
jgi:hypothetical protein